MLAKWRSAADRDDDAASKVYAECAQELRAALEKVSEAQELFCAVMQASVKVEVSHVGTVITASAAPGGRQRVIRTLGVTIEEALYELMLKVSHLS